MFFSISRWNKDSERGKTSIFPKKKKTKSVVFLQMQKIFAYSYTCSNSHWAFCHGFCCGAFVYLFPDTLFIHFKAVMMYWSIIFFQHPEMTWQLLLFMLPTKQILKITCRSLKGSGSISYTHPSSKWVAVNDVPYFSFPLTVAPPTVQWTSVYWLQPRISTADNLGTRSAFQKKKN